jgi:multiple sugar transport system substrate-binding protein
MKMVKRGIGLLTACLAAFALVGCGNSGQTSTNQSSAGSSNKPVTITETDYFTSDPGNTAIPQLIKKFEATHPNIKIQRNVVPRTPYLSKALQQATSHSLPNLLMLDNPWLQSFASTGALAPITTLGKIDTSNYFQGPLSTVTYNKQLYGLPIGNNDLVLFYNKKMLSAAHLTPPQTWDDLLKDAKALSNGNTYGIAFSAPNEEEATWQFEPFLWTNGGDLNKMDSPQALQALNLWVNLVKEGGASKSVLNWTQDNVETQFEQQRAAMEINGPWELSNIKKAGIDFGIASIPVPQTNLKAISPLGGEVFTIPTSTPDKEQAAFTFLQWMQQPANLIATDKAFGYIPANKTAADQLASEDPELKVFEQELITGRARTTIYGANYPTVSQDVWTAIQEAITGTQTPSAALKQAAAQISQVKQVGK